MKILMLVFLLYGVPLSAQTDDLSKLDALNPVQPAAGGAEGSGGDPVLNHWTRAQHRAVALLKVTHPRWLLPTAKSEIKAFYKTQWELEALYQDLDGTLLELRDSNANGKCLETSMAAKATIFISRQHCPSPHQMASYATEELLIGDTSHHFGKDDSFASNFGIAVIDGYRGGVPVGGDWYYTSGNLDMEQFRISGTQIAHTWDIVYEGTTGPVRPVLEWGDWDPQAGTFNFKGRFYIDWEEKRCTYPVSGWGRSNAAATELYLQVTHPRRVAEKDCNYWNTTEASSFVRKTTTSVNDEFPWLFIFGGVTPQKKRPSGGPWDYLYGK